MTYKFSNTEADVKEVPKKEKRDKENEERDEEKGRREKLKKGRKKGEEVQRDEIICTLLRFIILTRCTAVPYGITLNVTPSICSFQT